MLFLLEEECQGNLGGGIKHPSLQRGDPLCYSTGGSTKSPEKGGKKILHKIERALNNLQEKGVHRHLKVSGKRGRNSREKGGGKRTQIRKKKKTLVKKLVKFAHELKRKGALSPKGEKKRKQRKKGEKGQPRISSKRKEQVKISIRGKIVVLERQRGGGILLDE